MSIERTSLLSLHRQVADAIRAEIESGELPPGALLPSEKYLAEAHDVGRDVIRDAMAHLRSDGLIESKLGHRPRVRRSTSRITSTLQPSEEVITPDC